MLTGMCYAHDMARSATDFLNEALELPPEDRAAIATSLIESLDDDADDDAEALWAAEIARRVAEIKAGEAQLIPWTEVRRRLFEG